MTPDFRALCAELVDELDYQTSNHEADELIDRARTLLAEPVAEGPTDEEILAFCARYDGPTPGITAALRDFLARWGRPAAAPVPKPGEVGA